MKLLYVINHIDWFWSHRLPLAAGARDQGYDVHVAVTGADQDKELKAQGFTGHELPSPDLGFGPLTLIKIIFALRDLLKTERPDLVHAITLKYAFITGLAAIGLRDIKIVHTIAGLGYLFSGEGFKPKLLRILVGPFLRLALKGPYTKLIFQNPDDEKILLSRGFARPDQSYLIRGSGVDTSQFEATPIAQKGPPLIIMPTRLVYDKGVAVFVEAARILKKRGIPGRFQIAGGVTKNNPLAISEAEMHEMVADGAAEWLGKVSDMPALFAASHLVVYPSYYREGIPKVLLEAASSGRPIITTDHPGCREVVDEGKNGFLVPVKDAIATANAIERVLKDMATLQAMGNHSRKKAEAEFDVRIIVEQTLAVYGDAMPAARSHLTSADKDKMNHAA